MTQVQPVAVGDDGRYEDVEGSPILVALKRYWDGWKSDWRKSLADHRLKLRQAAILAQPAYAQLTQAGTIASDGTLVLTFGGPELGRRWVVRMLSVSDAGSYWTSLGAAQAVIATGMQPATSAVTPNTVRWPFSTLPNSATFGSDQMWIVPREKLYVGVTGGTSGQNVQASIWIQDFNQESIFPSPDVDV